MTTVNAYLTFNGNCEEAFEFYRSVFGGEFPYVGRYGDMPILEGQPPLPEHLKNKIMHISLPISAETSIMGSDAGGAWAEKATIGDNITLSINTKDPDEAKRYFDQLSAGGKVKMPFELTFWHAYYGLFTDKFGINWMVNCETSDHEAYEKGQK
ncbi:VOC family protein [Phaeocystidibacter marisrubri]|uniref:VOC family protein n=1 Tax=Phaeocystidibacter marisrubri TaxID=1577780 RepID=A0A6L3ZFK0_9FLAO|nr:VOC family protein [Phaeocystidibacter marisrubri]KAB2816187.1 VOC family protein [Phaeocystidibacter marisrubri]